MMGKDRQLRIFGMLLILNLAFIWGNSMLPADYSMMFSNWTMGILEPTATGTDMETGVKIVRKLAHFMEFGALGFLLCWHLTLLQKKRWFAVPFGMAAACVDETIQYFVPGRGPGLLDVGIDTCGVLAGILLLQIGKLLVRRKQQRHFGG